MFGRSTPEPAAEPAAAKRTVRQLQADPEVTVGVIVLDAQRSEYEARGFALVEDLAGDYCLMAKPEETA